jgi:pimeloyl-ACP methyl ester carboxylesterase
MGPAPLNFGIREKRSSLMSKARVWLIAPGVLFGLVAVTRLGHYALTTVATRAGPTSASTRNAATDRVSCFDTSPHKTTFVAVDPDVRLEVLDWGGDGAGNTMVLLTGSGDNAHVYDEFAYQFTDRFRVIGITRRGFGRSSQPADGYDLDTRARDDIAVLDKLDIRRAIFVGHSLAGTELTKLATAYPDRVEKLVYLDALDIGSGGWAQIPQPPRAPELAATDLESVQRLAAASALDDGFRRPLAAICNMVRMDASGKIRGPITPPEISGKLLAGLQPATYDRIRAPALGIFNKLSPQYRMPYYWALNPTEQEDFNHSIDALSTWTNEALQRFRSEVKGSRVVELPNTNHYVYIVEEPLVVREMRKFLLDN